MPFDNPPTFMHTSDIDHRHASDTGRTLVSFVVDRHPKFAYMGYHLAQSLREHSCDNWADIHVQFTQAVPRNVTESFRKLGCTIHRVEPFGDGRYCNKLAQLNELKALDFDHVFLLDTDMIAVDDIRPYLSSTALTAKVVDGPNPPLAVMREVAQLAGMTREPKVIEVDASNEPTFEANFNGGMYGIPKHLVEQVDNEWKRWALWLLDNIGPLERARKQTHVDQVAMWLAIHMERIPFQHAPSNANYYLHFSGPHRWLDRDSSIALLHYHDSAVNETGRLKSPEQATPEEQSALSIANAQIDRSLRTIDETLLQWLADRQTQNKPGLLRAVTEKLGFARRAA